MAWKLLRRTAHYLHFLPTHTLPAPVDSRKFTFSFVETREFTDKFTDKFADKFDDKNMQAGMCTFSQVAVSGNSAPVSRRRRRSAGGQADEADARVELDGALELEQRDVVVQRLPVVVVVDVGGGHAARLSARVRALAAQVVVPDAHEHRLAVAHQAARARGRNLRDATSGCFTWRPETARAKESVHYNV